MAEKQKFRFGGTLYPNAVPLMGSVEFGAGGAIANQTGVRDCGVTFAKNATGDYRATIHKGYKRVLSANCITVAPAAATAIATTSGTDAEIQGISSANFLGTSPCSSFAIATCRPDTGALADPVNGQFVTWELWVSE